jgi:hypothetical protein
MGNCRIAESPSSSHSFVQSSNSLLSLCPRALLLRSSFSQDRTYNPISCVPHRILRQRIACQFLLPSIVASCTSTLLANTRSPSVVTYRTSALLANTRSSLLLHLAPAHCLLIPAPFHRCIPCQYPLPSIVASHASALLANNCSSIIASCVGALPAKYPLLHCHTLCQRFTCQILAHHYSQIVCQHAT